MNENQNMTVFNIAKSDTVRFRRIVLDVMSEACSLDATDGGGIGTLGEKQMHAAIKRFICPDTECHEVLIDGSEGCINSIPDGGDARKKRRFVADVLHLGTVFEIQTGSFAPLREKLAWILENTNYNVVLIHPLAQTKWVSMMDCDGNIKSRKKSPKHESFRDVARELYYIRDLISSPRFSLILLMMEAEQYKKQISKEGARRPRYRKFELIPISLNEAHVFSRVSDYSVFLPEELGDTFFVKDYSALSGIRGRDAYSAVKTLCSLGFIEPDEKVGRAQRYRKTKT